MILQDVAKTNGKVLTREKIDDIRAILKHAANESIKAETSKLSYIDMFREDQLERTMILIANWCSSILLSYSLTLNIGDLGGDMTTNFILAQFVSALGVFIGYYLIFKLGGSGNIPDHKINFKGLDHFRENEDVGFGERGVWFPCHNHGHHFQRKPEPHALPVSLGKAVGRVRIHHLLVLHG